MMNRWRVSTLDLLHDLNASEAADTACSNSALVVSGTRVSSVWEAYGVDCSEKVVYIHRVMTHRVYDVYPVLRFALNKLASYKVLRALSRRAGAIPLRRQFLCAGAGGLAETAEGRPGGSGGVRACVESTEARDSPGRVHGRCRASGVYTQGLYWVTDRTRDSEERVMGIGGAQTRRLEPGTRSRGKLIAGFGTRDRRWRL